MLILTFSLIISLYFLALWYLFKYGIISIILYPLLNFSKCSCMIRIPVPDFFLNNLFHILWPNTILLTRITYNITGMFHFRSMFWTCRVVLLRTNGRIFWFHLFNIFSIFCKIKSVCWPPIYFSLQVFQNRLKNIKIYINNTRIIIG